jgi:hypothetical protein
MISIVRNWKNYFVYGVLIILAVQELSLGWYDIAHRRIASEAAQRLDKKLPAFFVEGKEVIAHFSLDPDYFCEMQTKLLRDGELPNHFISMEVFEGRPIPQNLYKYYQFCQDKKLNPATVGMLPYALAEGTQRLTLAFAEHRKWPDNSNIRMKCLIYAGMLSHYSGDATQPLHTTINHDGRQAMNEKCPRTGIHRRMDALIDSLTTKTKPDSLIINVYIDLLNDIVQQINISNGRVDRCYELEPLLPTMKEGWKADPAIQKFADDCYQQGVSFTASLFLTAWENSAKIKVPDWLNRAEKE